MNILHGYELVRLPYVINFLSAISPEYSGKTLNKNIKNLKVVLKEWKNSFFHFFQTVFFLITLNLKKSIWNLFVRKVKGLSIIQ